ncbi:endopeptidase DegP/Do [Ameyamaea chiangmaiensis NBRC 103196]|nr:endopeptidase DegP/Do [Ameyamaea chiangmaiensis NBRC 103196]
MDKVRAQAPLLIQTGPLTFAPLVRAVVPAVVNIAVTQGATPRPRAGVPPSLKGTPLDKRFRDRLRQRGPELQGAGSGFIIDPTGIIVTNTHVVGDADQVTVSLSTGKELPAHLLGTDDLTDIAVIKVDSPTPLPFLHWGDSRKVEVGDWILAAGNPFGLGSSVTAGIVSARGRDIGAGPFDDFLQLDAPINPGNSGGPTFNMRGEVVAVNTAIVSPTGGSVGIGFAIPSELVAPIVEELRRTGHIDRGWLGVTLEDGDGTDPVTVVATDAKGPAMVAGVRIGDVVLSAAGEHVESARGLIRAVAAARPGTSMDLVIRRHGKTITLPVIVGHRPDND